MDIDILTNKLLYNSMIKTKATNPVDFNNWSRHLILDVNPDLSKKYISLFFFFFTRK